MSIVDPFEVPNDEVVLRLFNFPATGDESITKEVVFGPESPAIAFLLQIDSDASGLEIVVGNGPRNEDLTTVLPDLLRELANTLQELDDDPDFWQQINPEGV